MGNPGSLQLLCLLVYVCIACCGGTKEAFKHEIRVDDRNIGILKLNSEGRFSDIIHLDTETGIKRLLCRHDKILIAFKESATVPKWRAGQIVLGGSKWACALASEAGGQHAGIYAKIRDVYRPKDDRLDLSVASVGPFDLLDEASIHFHYDPWASTKTKYSKSGRKSENSFSVEGKEIVFSGSNRSRRGTSNMLTDILNRIDWHRNVSMFVPFNYDASYHKQAKQFSIERKTGSENMVIKIKSLENKDLLQPPEYFSLDCISCSSVTRLVYSFDLKIVKIDNKPVLKQYISQVESEIQMQTDFALRFRKEMSINGSLLFWRTSPQELIKIPLAVVPGLPPVELLLSYDMDVIAHVQAAVNGPAVLRSKYMTKGSYVLSQTMTTRSPIQGDVSVYNWTVSPSYSRSMLPSLAAVKTAFKHRMGFNSSLVWSGKDVSISLSPQADITLEPEVSNTVRSDYFEKCLRSDVTISGNFSIQDAYFHVQAFGLEIWNKYLASGFQRRIPIVTEGIGNDCKARCVGPYLAGYPSSIDDVCGASTLNINRNHSIFSKQMLRGDSIMFSMSSNDTRCSGLNGSCQSCDNATSNVTDTCSSRLVTRTMAAQLVLLQRLAHMEWPESRLVVIEGWDEVTDDNPDGRHNVSSPYREGRAMLLALTEVTVGDRIRIDLYRRLTQLAVCSGFQFVALKKHAEQFVIEIGVTNDDKKIHESELPSGFDQKPIFDKAIRSAGTKYLSCTTSVSYKVGESYPRGQTVDFWCGPPTGRVHFLTTKTSNSLYEYPFNDVLFSAEGSVDNWCGYALRSCSACNPISSSDRYVSWDSCITRLMTPRLALRLRKLANLAKRASLELLVKQALAVEKGDNSSEMPHPLFFEGRAARITIGSSRTPANMNYLMNMVTCAGFDYVRYTSPEYLDIFVRRQNRYTEQKSYFPNGIGLLSVSSAENETAEYDYPAELSNEARQPVLMDGHNDGVYISKYYKISEFKDKAHRDFRLDASLVECLEEASDELKRKIEIVPGSAYRVRSVNFLNIDTRHEEEKSRYQTGQAVEVNLGRATGTTYLVRLGKALIRRCLPPLQQQQRCIGIGCHTDKLYVDIRPVMAGEETALIKVWNSGGDDIYKDLRQMADTVNTGGPIIAPLHRTSACNAASVVSSDKRYLSFQLGYQSQCTSAGSTVSDFCSRTRDKLSEQADKLQERLTSAAGSDLLPRRDIIHDINACVVDSCGGCPGTGPEWERKVRTCSRMIEKYLSRASRPFRELANRTTFFNPDNSQSTVHSLACHDGNVCVENIQLYSLLMPLITSTYRVNRENSVEERLFNNEDNPSPLLEIVGQELAMHAVGVVRVYIDSMGDLSRIRNVLKVAMVYNTYVSHVEFHISNDVNKNSVMATIQRKIETWAGNVCSDVSRLSITPFSIHSIHEHRLKRSIERSQARNQAKLDMRNWEMDWLLKL